MTPSKTGKPAAKTASSTEVMRLVQAAKQLSDSVDSMRFMLPVTQVYNPLNYAWNAHRKYLSLCQGRSTTVLFLGMNPGPWGMAQTGVPFGQVEIVRDWLGIEEEVGHPLGEHPKRKIEGFLCRRSEVSGARLWGLFRDRFKTPRTFFKSHFVVNYCPLVFMEASGKNRTPDKLQASEARSLQAVCDEHLSAVIEALMPSFLVGVGTYAEKCLLRVVSDNKHGIQYSPTIVRILHPSPASPAANKDWASVATKQLIEGGVWSEC